MGTQQLRQPLMHKAFTDLSDDDKIETFLFNKEPANNGDSYMQKMIMSHTYREELDKLYEEVGLLDVTYREGAAPPIKVRSKIYHEARQMGGWKKYIEGENAKKERQKKLDESVIASNKFQRTFAVVTGIFLFINAALICMDIYVANEASKDQIQGAQTLMELKELVKVHKEQQNLIQDYILFQKSQLKEDSLMKTKALKAVSKKH